MAKKIGTIVVEPTNKKTSIGRKNVKTSSMNKTKFIEVKVNEYYGGNYV